MNFLRFAALGVVFFSSLFAAEPTNDRVLVYTRNFVTTGTGYTHENIATSVAAIRELGKANGFEVDSSDDPKLFTDDNLRKYKAIIFSNSNNEAFENDRERDALKKFVQAGGGIVGIHSATGTERAWPYFWSLMGGKFIRHPKLQAFTVVVKDLKHPATSKLPGAFEWEDECYLFDKMNPDVRVLLATDPSKLDDPKKTTEPGGLRDGMYPLSWYNTFDGGRQYYLGLGHKKEHYAEPLFRQQLVGGILWVLRREK